MTTQLKIYAEELKYLTRRLESSWCSYALRGSADVVPDLSRGGDDGMDPGLFLM